MLPAHDRNSRRHRLGLCGGVGDDQDARLEDAGVVQGFGDQRLRCLGDLDADEVAVGMAVVVTMTEHHDMPTGAELAREPGIELCSPSWFLRPHASVLALPSY